MVSKFLFQPESYPNVIILEFSSPFTLESQGGQNELVSGSVQVPSADPPRPWTKIIFNEEVDELEGSTRILRPNWVEVLLEDIESCCRRVFRLPRPSYIMPG